MAPLSAAWRAILAEARGARARLVFFAGSLAVGVAAVVAVGALVLAFRAGLAAQSRSLLAGDLEVSARRPLPAELDPLLAPWPHRRSDVRELAALLVAGETSRLVELKAAGAGYPFLGSLATEPAGLGVAALGDDGALLAPELGPELGLELGQRFLLGGAEFRLVGWLLDEPDRLEFQMALGPRALIGLPGFERTDLGLAESRIKHSARFLFEPPLEAAALAAAKAALETGLPDAAYFKIQTHAEAQPALQRSLGQVQDFLGLVALLSLLLGGIGVSQVVRAWLAERQRAVALQRALGLSAREIAGIYLGNVALLASAGCLLGGLLGLLVPFAVAPLAPDLFPAIGRDLWQPSALPAGVGLGLFIALLFSLLPLSSVWSVPPAAVLRSEAAPLPAPTWMRVSAPLALALGLFASAWTQAGDPLWAAGFTVGVAALAGLAWLAAAGLTRAISSLPRGRLGPTLENGLAALARPGAGTAGALVALGLGVMVLVAMALIQSGLSRGLREALPSDAPSVFLLDVMPDQWEQVEAGLAQRGATNVQDQPVVMARLRAVDGVPVAELARAREDQGRSAWMLSREQRLTWAQRLPADNTLIAGALWSDPERPEVSVEADYAADLGARLGSVLRLDVQGVPIELTVTSLREVQWQSFGINFFLVVEPGVLEEAPHFRLAAARLPTVPSEFDLQTELGRELPNVTLLRVRPLLDKLAAVTARIAAGVSALGSFTAFTGLLILIGAIGAGALRRSREAALLKVLGVTRAGVRALFAVEYALLGAVAGLIGTAGGYALAAAFLGRTPGLELDLPWSAAPLYVAASVLAATLAGLAASRRALRTPPIETLRS
jgi:putative ABC transport system permease protein